MEEAIAIQNEIEYGLTAGLHSLDSDEMGVWLDTIQAGNLYVNRGITGAIVQRQPFGGWKKSAVGAGTKAGGPNYLVGLGSWLPAEPGAKRGATLRVRQRRSWPLPRPQARWLTAERRGRPCRRRSSATPPHGPPSSAPARTSPA